jgi:DNA-binding beta-propeller fold protein YncE
VRRTLVVCLVAILVVVVFAYAQQESPSTPEAIGHLQPMVVAQNLAARTLAVAPRSTLYLSLAEPQDRLFQLPISLAPSGNVSLVLGPVAGTGASGSLGDGGAALAAQLDLLQSTLYARSGIAVAPDGDVYIADTQNATIRRVAGAGSTEPGIIRSIAGRWAPQQNVSLIQPVGIALDRAGNLYIADRGAGSLDVLHADTGLLESLAQVAAPASVAVATDGTQAFVASLATGSVIAVDLRTRSVRAEPVTGNQPAASSGAGTSPCISALPTADSGHFCPSGLAVDGAGNLFVADLWNGRVWRIDARTGASSIALTDLEEPGALAFDSEGRNLYVVEQGQNRIIVANGMGGSSSFSLAPPTASFLSEPIGGVSQPLQFVVMNTSLNPVSGFSTLLKSSDPSTQNDFTRESTSCLSILAPSGTCSVNVAFTPTRVQAFAYSMDVVDASGNSLLTTPSTLTGTGDDYQIQLAAGQLQELSVIQGQAVTFHLQVQALGAFGQNGEQVSFLCPNDVPAQTTCTFSSASASPAQGSSAPFSVTFQTSSNNTHARAPIFPSWPSALQRQTLWIFSGLVLGFVALVFRARYRVSLVTAVALVAPMAFVGCHHATVTSTATPAGIVTMTVQGAALDKNGNPLNATRGYTIILDVIAK